ncbi:CHAT domain-containing protein [Desulfonema magnum]|uniref:CHAT domain-containing protein n=1 Tax=Desulfonema magnum TaxID=45655 RepID=A0A975BSE4_9BACT|nr:CHAT domain-containing protein [Desulfonema magnum]QTA90862.1 CHAT domain-containing protein [Desulfonema magnum]
MSNSKSSETEYSLKISIRDSDDAMRRSEDKSVRMPEIEHQWREIVEKINKKNSASVIRGDILEDLIRMGQGACGEFLTPDIREKLLTTRARYLILEVDADLVHLPWELLYLNGAFLCERFSMGRIPGTYQKTPLVEPRVLNKPLDMWIVADPRGDLPEAEAEGEMLCEYMDQMNLEEPLVYADLATSVGPDDVREKIKQYDLVHFAGHATYHPERPGQSGWRLTHGNFTASDIYETAVGKAMPALVFSNACQSASTAKWERSEGKSQDEPFGLANAFMLAGTKHYLGTSWEIKDKPGSDFARSFYESLLLGNTVGESVRLARDRLKQSGNNDSWAGYVLYGDPRISYLGKTEDKDWIKLQISVGAKSHIVTSEQSPPETAPTSSSNPVTPSDTQQHSPFILNLNHYLVVSVILIGLMAGFIGYALFNSGGIIIRQKNPAVQSPRLM